jgi:hypothetical protein
MIRNPVAELPRVQSEGWKDWNRHLHLPFPSLPSSSRIAKVHKLLVAGKAAAGDPLPPTPKVDSTATTQGALSQSKERIGY